MYSGMVHTLTLNCHIRVARFELAFIVSLHGNTHTRTTTKKKAKIQNSPFGEGFKTDVVSPSLATALGLALRVATGPLVGLLAQAAVQPLWAARCDHSPGAMWLTQGRAKFSSHVNWNPWHASNSGVSRPGPMGSQPVSGNEVLWNTPTPSHSHVVCGCLRATWQS